MKHAYLHAAILSLTLVAAPARSDLLSPAIVNPANGHSYYLISEADWFEAEAEARELGGHLVTVNDAQEQEWLVKTFAKYEGATRDLWLGLYRAEEIFDGFVWISGETSDFRTWYDGEPNNYGDEERYVGMLNSHDSRWNDFHWTTKLSGIVEIPAVNLR